MSTATSVRAAKCILGNSTFMTIDPAGKRSAAADELPEAVRLYQFKGSSTEDRLPNFARNQRIRHLVKIDYPASPRFSIYRRTATHAENHRLPELTDVSGFRRRSATEPRIQPEGFTVVLRCLAELTEGTESECHPVVCLCRL